MVIKILEALIALPKIADKVLKIIDEIVIWYIGRQNAETAAKIADAAALGARAKTQEERYAASERWRQALSRKSTS